MRLLAEGVELLRAKRIADATARFEAAARQNPKLPEAHYYWASCGNRVRPAGSSKRCRQALTCPVDGGGARWSGVRPRAAGQTDEAIAEFERAVALQPTLFDAHHLGATRWWTKRPDLAQPALVAAVTLNPSHPEAHYYLGLTLRQLGNLDGAIAELRESIRLNPRIAKAHAYLGVALRETGDLDAAATSLREALRIDPAEDDAANALGLVYMQRGDAYAAVATFKALVERAPGNSAARHNLGTALMQKGDLQAAVAEFRTLVTAEPGNAEAFYNLGTALKQQDDFTGLSRPFAGGAPQADLPEAHFTLGVVLWQTRRPMRPSSSGQRWPGSRPTRKRTTCSALSCARWDRTSRRWRSATFADPESAEAWLSIGQLLQRAHDASGSRRHLRVNRLRKKKADAKAATFAARAWRSLSGDVNARSRVCATPCGSHRTTRRRIPARPCAERVAI